MNSDLVRMSAFLGVLVLMAPWEMGAPRRSLSLPRGPRWFRVTRGLEIASSDNLKPRETTKQYARDMDPHGAGLPSPGSRVAAKSESWCGLDH
jgi:hypothetical protein